MKSLMSFVGSWASRRRSWLMTASAVKQGLTLVHIRAQLEQLQDTFTSRVGLYVGQKSSYKLS